MRDSSRVGAFPMTAMTAITRDDGDLLLSLYLYRLTMYNPEYAMFTPSPLRRELSLVVLMCTLGVLLFPSPTGPYTAVHGPVTALRALRNSLATLWSIAMAALRRSPWLHALLGGLMGSHRLAILQGFFLPLPRPGAVTVLRC
jgi:hypothetical protein